MDSVEPEVVTGTQAVDEGGDETFDDEASDGEVDETAVDALLFHMAL